MKFTRETIKGKQFEINIDDGGKFYSVEDNNRIEADTLVALRAKLASGMRKAAVKVAIRVVWWDKKLKHGTFTGIHARNENLLLREDDGKTEQLSSWEGKNKYFAPEQADTLAELSAAADAANKALEAFAGKHAFDIRREIQKIVETADGAA